MTPISKSGLLSCSSSLCQLNYAYGLDQSYYGSLSLSLSLSLFMSQFMSQFMSSGSKQFPILANSIHYPTAEHLSKPNHICIPTSNPKPKAQSKHKPRSKPYPTSKYSFEAKSKRIHKIHNACSRRHNHTIKSIQLLSLSTYSSAQ